ncbi:hypothetical protein SAMN05216374_0965 [Tardiphaga sp. OK246]|uniref:hypothetical protein n=1 Tax=Tardiphaga sp. OK246 TaxID=1855307 RepID=UPI000B6AE65D|nr:hypothetical protein [Tardiphaga sp. OK246]SNS35891.1 hypothetical protein SAMN05216374_0965 [Tardiphaga sp. OK246]
MADLKYAGRVAETAVTYGATGGAGMGDIFLSGAIDTDHSAFSAKFADGDLIPVSVYGGGKWLEIEGTYNLGANSISRTTFRDSSTGVNLALSGTMTVLCGWGAADARAMIRNDRAQSFNATQKNQALANVGGVGTDSAQSLSGAQKDQASVNIGTVRAVRVQKFVYTGIAQTYTPDPNLLYAIAEGIAGGGGGAGVPGPGASQITVGGGGQAGSYARRLLTAVQIGASQTATVGNGGNGGSGAANGSTGGSTSLGSLLSAGGGGGGATMGAGAGIYAIQGGSGGVATVGDVLVHGEPGLPGIGVYPMITGGQGGSSNFGAGGAAVVAVGVASNGNSAPGFGGGGSGSGSASAGGGGTGGSGGSGLLVITEFCSK